VLIQNQITKLKYVPKRMIPQSTAIEMDKDEVEEERQELQGGRFQTIYYQKEK